MTPKLQFSTTTEEYETRPFTEAETYILNLPIGKVRRDYLTIIGYKWGSVTNRDGVKFGQFGRTIVRPSTGEEIDAWHVMQIADTPCYNKCSACHLCCSPGGDANCPFRRYHIFDKSREFLRGKTITFKVIEED